MSPGSSSVPDASPQRLAYVGRDGQLHVLTVHPDGHTESRQITWSLQVSTESRWGVGVGGTTTMWPCWSPRGGRIACFVDQVDSDNTPRTRVAVLEVDGVHEHRLAPLPDRMPIHLQWSPDGSRLGVLVQFEEQLELWVADTESRSGELRLVTEGSPLFFAWARGGDNVVLHVGDPGDSEARLEVRDIVGDDDDIVFRIPPGNFCVPFVHSASDEERVLYVIQRHHDSQVVSARLDGEDVLGLGVSRGLLALVPTPDGSAVAFAAAPDADGSPYERVQVVPTNGFGAPTDLIESPVLAFFWRPQHAEPCWAALDRDRRHVLWFAGHPDGPTQLARTLPTRDQYFHLHFFEQFACSHSLVSSDGRWMAWASHEPEDDETGPTVYLTDLNASNPIPVPICPGSYAVFATGTDRVTSEG